MKTIFKYHLDIKDLQILDLPLGSRILSVLNQNENLVLYAEHNTLEKCCEQRHIRVVGTGYYYDSPFKLEFIGSVSFHGGSLIFHVFEEQP